MRLEQLQCLLDVAQTGSLTSTAKRLFVSQQAVSKSIKQLEEELGVTILTRTKTGVTFTEEGIAVMEFARKVLAEQDNLLQNFQIRQNGGQFWKNQKIVIGTTSSIANVILPDIVAELMTQQTLPAIQMMALDSFDTLLEQVLQGSCDIGLTAIRTTVLPEKIADYTETLETESLMHDEFVVAMNKRFYNSCETCIDANIYGNALVKTSYDILSLSDSFTEKRYNANIICSNDADFHRSMMDKAGAMTMMSGLAYRFYFSNKKYIALPYEGDTFSLVHVAIYRKDASAQVREFVAMIRREMYMK
ncbi:MAG: LysR family transcriptional regulator [Peptococcaceae bacterium]|nr:LysR family transcriptional regulator [Peptococcaceae bacterium]